MSLLIISQHYRPEPNFIPTDVAEFMAARTPVTVITSHPHYPFGRFYTGTRWWLPSITVENGVRVCRIPMYPDHSRSAALRLASYLSFTICALLAAITVGGRPAVVWVYQGPFTTALAALYHKYVRGSRLVITCADLWPESFTAAGVVNEGIATRLARLFRRWLNRRADLIIGSTRGTLRVFHREGIPMDRLAYAPVWVSTSSARSSEHAPKGEPAIVYAGNLGPAQALDVVIRGAAQLKSEGIDVKFHIYGTGSEGESLKKLALDLGASNVTFMGSVPAREAFEACAASIAQIVSLRPSPLFAFTVPSKLSFSLAAGAPVLYALDGEAKDILTDSGGGFAYSTDDTSTFVSATRRVLSLDPSSREILRAALRSRYSSEFEPEMLMKQYGRLLNPTAS